MIMQYDESFDVTRLTQEEIDWIIENEEIVAIENNPKVKNGTITIGNRVIRNRSNAREGIMGMLNKKRQKERQEEYGKRVSSGADNGKIRIVSEGDSWFNYPTKMKETIDHIFDDFSIFSVGYAGDWLANIYKEQEYMQAIRLYKPDAFLISGGGNDLVGGKRMLEILNEYEDGHTIGNLIKEDVFNSILEDFRVIYLEIFTQVKTENPDIKIVCHGYDYPYMEGKDKVWFGKPFKEKGIENTQLQNEIGEYLIDRFNEMISRVAASFDEVYYISHVGQVPRNQWKDELHPNEEGFKVVASNFRNKVNNLFR